MAGSETALPRPSCRVGERLGGLSRASLVAHLARCYDENTLLRRRESERLSSFDAAMTTTLQSTTDVQLTQAQSTPRRVARARGGTASWGRVAFAADAAMLTAAVLLSALTSATRAATPVFWAIAFALLVLAFLYTRGMYRLPLQLRVLDGLRAILTATALAAAAVISARVVLTDSSAVGAETVRIWVFATILLATVRLFLIVFEWRARRAGEAGHPTLIVGAGKVGRLTASRLREHPEIGLKPVGFLDKEPFFTSEEIGLPVLGASWDLERIIEEHGIEHVVVTFSTAPEEVLLRLVERCEQLGVRSSLVPRLYEKATEQFTVVPLGGLPLISSHARDPKGWQFAAKHVIDRAGAAVALVLLAPVMAALAVAVYLSSGRPVFYRAERIGRDGESFDMLKFRSMRVKVGAEQTELRIASGSDNGTGGAIGVDRRTRLGALMRRTSLDELPQLFNVLKGEMSFIGPRPERTEYVRVYEQRVHRYAKRHRVKSGITGWAQVNGLRGSTSLTDRIEWDNYYIENWSPWLDFKILLLTLVAVARPGPAD
jgi:exopolysaccharide biosynthesis polyprenyl glycosylphosphotransferase